MDFYIVLGSLICLFLVGVYHLVHKCFGVYLLNEFHKNMVEIEKRINIEFYKKEGKDWNEGEKSWLIDMLGHLEFYSFLVNRRIINKKLMKIYSNHFYFYFNLWEENKKELRNYYGGEDCFVELGKYCKSLC